MRRSSDSAAPIELASLTDRLAKPSWEGPAAAALILAALAFGGASQQNALQVGFLELAGLALLVVATVVSRTQLPATARMPVWLLAAIALLPLLQLIPMPPALWRALPERAGLAADLGAAGMGETWRPLSLAPDLTLRSILALLPPAGVFLVTLRTSLRARRTIALGLVLFALVSVLLGLAQVAGGPDSALRFYARTNADAGVGFFANRNHFALLLVIAIPFVAALAAEAGGSQSPGARRLAVAAAIATYVVLVVGVGVGHSRAAVLLLAPAMVCGFLILFARPQVAGRRPLALLFGGAGLVAVALVIAFSFPGLAERFAHAPETELRWQTAPVVAGAGAAYAPLGAGIGAFDPVYRSVEPTRLLSPEYLNHAHDDFLEVWLEAGFLGVGLILVALGWLVRSSIGAWRSAPPAGGLERAASAASVLMVLASAVDYPLRTLTHACLFAFFSGILAAPTIPRPPPLDSAGPEARRQPTNITPLTRS